MKTKKKSKSLIIVALLGAVLLCASCSSNEHMYRHNRSHCDCPTF